MGCGDNSCSTSQGEGGGRGEKLTNLIAE